MYKFQVQVNSGQTVGFDSDRWKQMIGGTKDGDYEILFRRKVSLRLLMNTRRVLKELKNTNLIIISQYMIRLLETYGRYLNIQMKGQVIFYECWEKRGNLIQKSLN